MTFDHHAGSPEAEAPPLALAAPLSAADRALIDAAIAAGKVTVVPAEAAAGLSPLERQWWTAPPPAAQFFFEFGARGGRATGRSRQQAKRAA